MQLADLSHTIEPGMPVSSPSVPQPKIYPWLSHALAANSGTYSDCSCEITELRFLTSLGTYLDSPYHWHPEKKSTEGLVLDQLVLPGVVVDCTLIGKRRPAPARVPKGIDVTGKAVLFYTNWSQYWEKRSIQTTLFNPRHCRSIKGWQCQVCRSRFSGNPQCSRSQTSCSCHPVEKRYPDRRKFDQSEESSQNGFYFPCRACQDRWRCFFPIRAYGVIS